MALAGVHVTCAYAGSRGFANSNLPIIGKAAWAETLTSAGTTTNAAPAPTEQSGQPLFQVTAAADAFVSIGAAPDANGNTKTRYFIKGGQPPVEIAAAAGDKLAWVAA